MPESALTDQSIPTPTYAHIDVRVARSCGCRNNNRNCNECLGMQMWVNDFEIIISFVFPRLVSIYVRRIKHRLRSYAMLFHCGGKASYVRTVIGNILYGAAPHSHSASIDFASNNEHMQLATVQLNCDKFVGVA